MCEYIMIKIIGIVNMEMIEKLSFIYSKDINIPKVFQNRNNTPD